MQRRRLLQIITTFKMASKSSNIWDFFEQLHDDNHGNVEKCNTCKSKLKAPGRAASGSRKHLKMHPKQAQLLQWGILEQAAWLLKDFKATTVIWSSEKEATTSTVVERLFVKLAKLSEFVNKPTSSLNGR